MKINKIMLFSILSICLLAVTACSSNKKDAADKKDDTQVSNPEQTSNDDNTDNDKEVTEAAPSPTEVADDSSSEGEEYIPDFIHDGEPMDYTDYMFFDAYLDVKAPSYHEVSDGIQNFHFGDTLTIGYFEGEEDDMEGIEKIEDVMDQSIDRIYRGTERYITGDFDHLEFDSEEKVTINGIDMMRYEGNMIVTGFDSDKRYVVAYTFIYNNTPNAIFGCVGDIYQEQKYIDELIHNVDESVKTIAPQE